MIPHLKCLVDLCVQGALAVQPPLCVDVVSNPVAVRVDGIKDLLHEPGIDRVAERIAVKDVVAHKPGIEVRERLWVAQKETLKHVKK